MPREDFPIKTTVLLDFVQMRGGRALPKFLAPFHKCIFGEVIWTKSKRTAAFFGKPTLIWSGPRIRLKQINQRLSGLDELGDKAKDAEGR